MRIIDKKVSIASDASNKGNVKLFPIGVQSFDIDNGIVNFVLDFYEDPNEKSLNIYNRITNCLTENGISIESVIAYSGDNASVNYGIHQSVYVNFKNQNDFIVKANCNCHVLHNTINFAMLKLPLDIENLILKIYSHFSISAKRVDQLKSCYEFADKEFECLKRHVTTRWLTFYPAICRLLDHISPIKSYFISVGTDSCPDIINELVWTECNKSGMNFAELIFNFAGHVMKLFHVTIKILEMKSTNSTNLFDIMFKLKTQLENRLKTNFFGTKVNENLKYFSESEKNRFEVAAKMVYNCG